MKEIKLTQGKVTIVDDDDYDMLMEGTWQAHYEKHRWYVTGRYKGKQYRMHRLIMKETDPKTVIDHKNGDGLNNQKRNLRRATTSQNISNGRIRQNFTSKYKGVHWDKFNNKWRVQVQSQEGIVRLGRFGNEVHAALAYNDMAVKIQGEFARINLIDELVIGENY